MLSLSAAAGVLALDVAGAGAGALAAHQLLLAAAAAANGLQLRLQGGIQGRQGARPALLQLPAGEAANKEPAVADWQGGAAGAAAGDLGATTTGARP